MQNQKNNIYEDIYIKPKVVTATIADIRPNTYTPKK